MPQQLRKMTVEPREAIWKLAFNPKQSTDKLRAAEWLFKLVPASRIQPSRNVLIIYSFLVLMNCSPMTNFLKHAHCCLLVSDFPQQLSDLRPGSDAELFISRTSIIR